jgi:VanZ family protein
METTEMSIKVMLRVCSVAVLFFLVLAALGPAQWVPRSGLGWRVDHFVGYFAFTLTFCIAWPRPFAVGGAIVALALLLEGLQALTPDRHADLNAAVISAGGAMAAIMPADFLVRAPRRLAGRAFLTLARAGLLVPAASDQAKLPALAGPVRRQLQSS